MAAFSQLSSRTPRRLPEGLPYINFDRYPAAAPGQSRKFPGLTRWLKEQAVAIVDDEIGLDLRAWATGRRAPTLLVEIDRVAAWKMVTSNDCWGLASAAE